jgi:hypothetical protein
MAAGILPKVILEFPIGGYGQHSELEYDQPFPKPPFFTPAIWVVAFGICLLKRGQTPYWNSSGAL